MNQYSEVSSTLNMRAKLTVLSSISGVTPLLSLLNSPVAGHSPWKSVFKVTNPCFFAWLPRPCMLESVEASSIVLFESETFRGL
jgi:hypothetical protein